MLLGNLYNKVHYPARLEGVLFFLFRKPKSDLKNGLDCVVDLFLSCTITKRCLHLFKCNLKM